MSKAVVVMVVTALFLSRCCIFSEVLYDAFLVGCLADVMSWRGHDVYDCTAEFRIFWGHSKLAEVQHPGDCHPPCTSQQQQQQQQQQGRRRFVGLPAYEATPTGLQAAYSTPAPFSRDGLYFIHRQAHYALGQTPLALTWKDAASSRYFLDTDAQGAVLPQQTLVLQYQMDCTVATGDDPPVTLGTMPAAFAQLARSARLRPGRLLRFGLGPGGVHFHDGQPVRFIIIAGCVVALFACSKLYLALWVSGANKYIFIL